MGLGLQDPIHVFLRFPLCHNGTLVPKIFSSSTSMASRLCRSLRTSKLVSSVGRFIIVVRNRSTESAHLECPHDYAKRSDFLESWKNQPPSSDPKEAQRRLAMLRREYKKQVKEVRREYAYEMEMQRLEKLRKEEARREAVRVAKEEREAVKAAAAKVAAAERKALEDELRQTLLKERTEKLEMWRAKEKIQEEKRDERKELLRRQSSMWIDDSELDKRITEALVDTTQL